MSKLYSIEISKSKWGIFVWIQIILGAIIFSIFNSTFFIPKEAIQSSLIASVGGILIGWGFGLAYSRLWKIKGIDK